MNVQNQPPLPRAPHPRPALTQLVPPFAARPTADRVWLVAAHGGAGCTTIRMSARDRYADAGRGLPVSALLADWNAGLFGQTILMGVAVTMPLPKTPRELRKGALLVGSAAPALWRLPFIRGLDLDGFPETYPRAYAKMLKDLEAAGGTA